jgi:hypothetical protein
MSDTSFSLSVLMRKLGPRFLRRNHDESEKECVLVFICLAGLAFKRFPREFSLWCLRFPNGFGKRYLFPGGVSLEESNEDQQLEYQ